MDFTEFVTDRQHTLLRFATALSGDSRRAEEIVADVLARAYEQWDRISRLEQVNAYVRRMIVNEFLSRKRRDHRTIPLADLTGYAEHVPDPATGHAQRDALIAQLATLTRRQRAAIVLRYYEGLSDTEIADTLGCALGTVRSNISRGLAILRVEQREPDPPGDRTRAPMLTVEEH